MCARVCAGEAGRAGGGRGRGTAARGAAAWPPGGSALEFSMPPPGPICREQQPGVGALCPVVGGVGPCPRVPAQSCGVGAPARAMQPPPGPGPVTSVSHGLYPPPPRAEGWEPPFPSVPLLPSRCLPPWPQLVAVETRLLICPCPASCPAPVPLPRGTAGRSCRPRAPSSGDTDRVVRAARGRGAPVSRHPGLGKGLVL